MEGLVWLYFILYTRVNDFSDDKSSQDAHEHFQIYFMDAALDNEVTLRARNRGVYCLPYPCFLIERGHPE